MTAPVAITRIADYTLVRLLGEGSQGKVFLAETPARLARSGGVGAEHVALKQLNRGVSPDEFARAAEELKRVSSAQSPHLVPLYETGLAGGRVYYAMEHYPLGSLASPGRPLRPEEALVCVADAARAAHALHEVGVAHRAIKPSNILMADAGGRLGDVGLTHLLSPGQTVSGLASIHSVEYMEPGVMRGEKASRASDIWALGVVLHRALTGRSIYREVPPDLLSALRQVLSSSPQLDPSLRSEQAEVVRACLAPDPAERPHTAAEVADRIDALGGRSR